MCGPLRGGVGEAKHKYFPFRVHAGEAGNVRTYPIHVRGGGVSSKRELDTVLAVREADAMRGVGEAFRQKFAYFHVPALRRRGARIWWWGWWWGWGVSVHTERSAAALAAFMRVMGAPSLMVGAPYLRLSRVPLASSLRLRLGRCQVESGRAGRSIRLLRRALERHMPKSSAPMALNVCKHGEVAVVKGSSVRVVAGQVIDDVRASGRQCRN
mmetsp:Transcript_5570/g.10056  ORF Transcript_5570/g.10056 Transcript_5570/m.10056 type:complete len:212 (+) Transcript_5570:6253-6888(+)